MNMKRFFLLFLSVSLISLFIACEGTKDDPDIASENYESTIDDAASDNSGDHEDAGDYTWNTSDVTQITLNGNSISVNGTGATASGSKVIITEAGNYNLSGSLDNGQVIVSTEDENLVRIILSGVDIKNTASAPIFVVQADKTVIVLADDSQNSVTDGSAYVFESSDSDEPNAAIFSKSDLTICGNGSLTVDANYRDGISSKDGLIIKNGIINVNAADDGIRGKDYLIVKAGTIHVTANGDGLKSDNDEDAGKGYISFETGTFNITSGGDAITAVTDVLIRNGEFIVSSGGGSGASISETLSAKGIKGVVNTIIEAGTFAVNSADDAIHSNGRITINGGTFTLLTGDDGIHSDSELEINGGDIAIAKSYEGLESAYIAVNSGNILIAASDDGINGAGGPVTSSQFGSVSSGDICINNGYMYVESLGDGIDINGSVEMSGGTLIVNGPTNDGNGALDYDGTFKLSGGYLIAAGSSGMAQAPGASSTQNSVLVNFSSAQQAGALVHFQTSEGDEILTFKPTKKYQSVAFSSNALLKGSKYNIYTGGSSTGTPENGVYLDGSYTPGNLYTSFTVSGVLTSIGNSGNMGGNPGGTRP
jgi:hypothetical protein